MSDLRDQLLKAGLVTDKQAQGAERSQRKKRKSKGERAARRDDAAKRQQQQQLQTDRARQDRQRSLATRSAEEEKELALRIGQIVGSSAPDVKIGGRKRWYYVDHNGRVPFRELSDAAAGLLESGAAALVQGPDGPTRMITAAGARRVAELDDRWLVFWAR